MATVKQIQYRLGQARKTLTKLTKGLVSAKAKVKKLEAQLKRAKAVEKARPKKKARSRPKAKSRKARPKARRKARPKAKRRTAARRRR